MSPSPGGLPWPTDAETRCRLYSVSPEWAPRGLGLELLVLPLALVGAQSPPAEGLRRKVLRLLVLLELKPKGKQVPVSLLPVPVPSDARIPLPPVLAHRAKVATRAPSIGSLLSH